MTAWLRAAFCFVALAMLPMTQAGAQDLSAQRWQCAPFARLVSGIQLFGKELELKFEARNIFGTKYKEMQESGDNRIYYNLYKTGTTFSLGGSLKF